MLDILKSMFSTVKSTKEIIKPTYGVFNLSLVEGDTVVHSFTDKNLIVDTGFLVLAGLVTSGASSKVIDTIALGNQGIVNNKFVFPVITDQTLRTETFRKTGCVFSINELGKEVEFVFTLEELEGNGPGARLYNEAGLFSHDGTMMARRVFPECMKTPNQKMIIRWVLSWS